MELYIHEHLKCAKLCSNLEVAFKLLGQFNEVAGNLGPVLSSNCLVMISPLCWSRCSWGVNLAIASHTISLGVPTNSATYVLEEERKMVDLESKVLDVITSVRSTIWALIVLWTLFFSVTCRSKETLSFNEFNCYWGTLQRGQHCGTWLSSYYFFPLCPSAIQRKNRVLYSWMPKLSTRRVCQLFVKISRARYIVITPHTELWIHTSTDFTVGKNADISDSRSKI